MAMITSATCPKCGSHGDGCPIYHGTVDAGYCPIFADGQTAEELVAQYHKWWHAEARENDRLRRELRASFFGRLFLRKRNAPQMD